MTHLKHNVTVVCRRTKHLRCGKPCVLTYHTATLDLVAHRSERWVGACGRELDEPRCPDADDTIPF